MLDAVGKLSVGCMLVFFLPLFSVFVQASAEGLEVSCQIESEGFLTDEVFSLQTEKYVLSNVATKAGGRHLLYHEGDHEVWVKTNAYVRKTGVLTVTAFSIVHIDKVVRRMAEAASSAMSEKQPRFAVLTVHGLSDQMALSSRVIVSCTESGWGSDH